MIRAIFYRFKDPKLDLANNIMPNNHPALILSVQEKADLEHLSRQHSAPRRLAERAKIIPLASQEYMSAPSIADALHQYATYRAQVDQVLRRQANHTRWRKRRPAIRNACAPALLTSYLVSQNCTNHADS